MKFITCPNCGKGISDQETICPHCGSPINPHTNTNTNIAAKEQTNIPPAGKKNRNGFLLIGCLGIFIVILFVPILIGLLVNSMIENSMTDTSSNRNGTTTISTTFETEELNEILYKTFDTSVEGISMPDTEPYTKNSANC